MKKAHITSRPNHQVGDKVIALCGTKFKVKQLWDDIPDDKSICRPCVNGALVALTEADQKIETSRRSARRLKLLSGAFSDDLDEWLQLDAIAAVDSAYEEEIENKAFEKTQKQLAKQTCTCTWETPEIFHEDPNCPIHSSHDEGEEITTEEANQ